MAKEYPSIWITEQIEPDVKPVHYNKPTLEEPKTFCIDRYGKYDSIKRAI